jgi:hypothetical protein
VLAFIVPLSAVLIANAIKEGGNARHSETLAEIRELKALIQRSARQSED